MERCFRLLGERSRNEKVSKKLQKIVAKLLDDCYIIICSQEKKASQKKIEIFVDG
ncbi:hypothetical protein [Enterococcus pseudoavium]|uniref:hypothetical protein n=1 Tax=Enterococcus pseudoavium TaxID=44007 RepID=UPI0035DE9483